MLSMPPMDTCTAVPNVRAASLVVAVLGIACGFEEPSGPAAQVPSDGHLSQAPVYVVQVMDGVDPTEVIESHDVLAIHEFRDALTGFAAPMWEPLLFQVLDDPRVRRVHEDVGVETTAGEQIAPGWGLDRIDQRGDLLDGVWRYDYEGLGTTAYVVDTGIRVSHQDFQGRARVGMDLIGGSGADCNGHGTHVAGAIGGERFGVAKSASVVGVRVLDCEGNGRVSDVVAGLDWILANHAGGPAVVNLSFGGIESAGLDAAVSRVLAAGLLVISSAGNAGEDACLYSPARVDGVLTVGATDRDDRRPAFSNSGPCVDLYAPGVDIASAYHRSDDDAATITGTSSAAPRAAGVALMTLEQMPGLSPAQLLREILGLATKDVVQDAASPNAHLLFAPQSDGVEPDPLPPPLPAAPPAPSGFSVQADADAVTLSVAWDRPASADEIEIGWRPAGGSWETDRARGHQTSRTLRHLRSETVYEVRIRARLGGGGGWSASQWTGIESARTCARQGNSSRCR